ncbi:hypothetical protein [Methanobrevibacter sp.]|uniref:hypothetical protein n=1 Tax=Methanobrevibacter sp. TaxID=66852 RepID=UPI0038673E72
MFSISCVSATEQLDANSTIEISDSNEWNDNSIQEDTDYDSILTHSVDETNLCKTDTKTISYEAIRSVENGMNSNPSENNVLKEAKGDFNLLQDLINQASANSVITLNRDYTFTAGLDDDLINGIYVNKNNLTIDGNGHTINALGKARIFFITSNYVTLTNINFINGYVAEDNYWRASGPGGAIFYQEYTNHNLVYNCNFVNNTADNGGAIYFYGAPYCTIASCNFINNTAIHEGGAINFNYWMVIMADMGLEWDSFSDYCSLIGCNFVNCSADNGGAVYWDSDYGIITSCNFINPSKGYDDYIIIDSYSTKIKNMTLSISSKNRYLNQIVTIDYNISSWAKGMLTVYLDDSFIKNVSIGNKIELNNLTVGKHSVKVTYNGAGFVVCENVTNFEIYEPKKNTSISAVYNVSAKELIANLFNDVTGQPILGATIRFKIKDDIYTNKTNNNGQAKLSVANLTLGTYNAIISYGGNTKYNPSSANLTIPIKENTNINVVYNANDKELIATLINEETDKPISDATITIVLNNVRNTLKTDSNGQAKLSIADLSPGTYTATVSYDGTAEYNSTNASVNFIIKTNTRLSVVYNDNTKELIANLVNDVTAQPILGAALGFKINNKYYTIKTDNSGLSKLSVADLPFGTYNAIVSYGGNTKYNPSSANVNVPLKANTSFNVVYNANDKELIATLLNDVTGQTIKGATVAIILTNMRANLKTDANGQIKFSTNDLASGVYPTTVSYGGNTKYNSTKTTFDVVINVKTSISAVYKNGILTATLINNASGQGINGADLLVSFGDVNYTVKTNTNGQAKVSTRDLTPGSYTAVVSYDGSGGVPSNTSIPIQVKTDAYFIVEDISIEYNTNAELVATLINYATSKGIVGATVGFKINGKSYTAKTDAHGQAKVSISGLNPGNYNTTVSYNGNTKYNPASTTFNVLVNKITTSFSTYYDSQSNEIVATLINEATGKGIVGGTVGIFLNNVKNIIVTDTNGQARLSLGNVNPNSFTAYTTYAGNTKYLGSSRTITPVENKIESYISTTYNKETNEVITTLINKATGKAIIGGTVNIVVNNVRNNIKTDTNGQAKVSIADLAPNVYSVTSSYA